METALHAIPELETERLILRGQRPEDVEALVRAYGDEGFARFITREARALSKTEAWYAIALVAGSWATAGYGQWIVEERASGAPVGRIGPWAPPGWPGFEIGWAIFPEHQGKGYALEGAAAAIAWSYDRLGRDHVIHLIDPLNAASERVAAALGAEVTGEWKSPLCPHARIWTTCRAQFLATPAGRRYASS